MLNRIRPLVVLAVAGVLPALAGNVPGIKNFDQVDAHVYRGAQPTGEGFRYLARIGVKTVIDLREAGERAQAEERIIKASGMAYVNVPMTGLTPPTEAELLKILPVLENLTGGPSLCTAGAGPIGPALLLLPIISTTTTGTTLVLFRMPRPTAWVFFRSHARISSRVLGR